jgi:lysophospholipid acyltransferase (LPLAT)-like uncharacterized protein
MNQGIDAATMPRQAVSARPLPDGKITGRRSLKDTLLYGVLATLAAGYIRLLGSTTKVTWYGAENVPPPPFIYAFWHSRLLFLVYSHRHQGVKVVVSKSKDGELIAAVLNKFGFGTIRGSSSRAAREAALHTLRALKTNSICAITPDGPRGPAREVKDGLSYLARKTGVPIVPLSYAAKRKKVLNSWDRFLFPLPFNKTVVVVGKPFRVDADEDLADANRRIAAALNDVTTASDRLTAVL